MTPDTEPERLIDREEFAKRAGVSSDWIKRLEKLSPGFPRPVQIPGIEHPRRRFYKEREVQDWMKALKPAKAG